TTNSQSHFESMAKTHGQSRRQSDSHSEGITVFNQAPSADFGPWIAQFRQRFEIQLAQDLSRHGYGSMAGMTTLIFSIDNSRRLRGRVMPGTTAPADMTDCLLSTTRAMDGNSVLSFPNTATLNGFNFSMAWNYPEQPVKNDKDVHGTLSSNNVYGRVN